MQNNSNITGNNISNIIDSRIIDMKSTKSISSTKSTNLLKVQHKANSIIEEFAIDERWTDYIYKAVWRLTEADIEGICELARRARSPQNYLMYSIKNNLAQL